MLGEDGTPLYPVRAVSLTEITDSSDRGPDDYPTRNDTGALGNTTVPRSTSLRLVLRTLLEIPTELVDQVDITQDGDPIVSLSRTTGDFEAPGTPGFPFEGGHPPVFYRNSGTQLSFIRPLREGNPQDVNIRDQLQSDTNGALLMTVRTQGRPLRPRVEASAAKTERGKPVQLRVSGYDGQPPSGPLRYSWDFSDGSSGPDQADVDHAWAAKGEYTVTVTVRQQDGGAAGVGSVTVKVGKPKKEGSTPKGGGDADGGPANGADGGKGDQAGADPSSPGGTGDTGTSTAPGQAGDPVEKEGDATPSDAGVEVRGVLLNASAAEAVTVPVTPSAPVANAASGAPKPIPTDRRWMLAIAPLVLLLAGAARQSRWLARRTPELPWRTM